MSANFHTLMREAYDSHQEFHRVWRTYYKDIKKVEPESVTAAREIFFLSNDRLFNEINKYEKDFFSGDSNAIDAVLNFLEIDIPAFRAGYAKQKFFRKLKSFGLNEIQKQRIRKLAYNMCVSDSYRVEFRDLARLMILIADYDFVESLADAEREPNGIVEFKIRLMLQTITQNRKDLIVK